MAELAQFTLDLKLDEIQTETKRAPLVSVPAFTSQAPPSMKPPKSFESMVEDLKIDARERQIDELYRALARLSASNGKSEEAYQEALMELRSIQEIEASKLISAIEKTIPLDYASAMSAFERADQLIAKYESSPSCNDATE